MCFWPDKISSYQVSSDYIDTLAVNLFASLFSYSSLQTNHSLIAFTKALDYFPYRATT